MADNPIDITDVLELQKINEKLREVGTRPVTTQEYLVAKDKAQTLGFADPTSKGELVPFSQEQPPSLPKRGGLWPVLRKLGRRIHPALGLADLAISNYPSEEEFKKRSEEVASKSTTGLETLIDFVKGKNPPVSRRDFLQGVKKAGQMAATPNLPISSITEVVEKPSKSITFLQANNVISNLRSLGERLHNEAHSQLDDPDSKYSSENREEAWEKLDYSNQLYMLEDMMHEMHEEFDTPEGKEEHKKLDIQLGMRGEDYYEEGYGDTVLTLKQKRKLLEEMPAYLLPTEEEMLEMEKNWTEPEDKTDLFLSNSPPYKRVPYPKKHTLSEINEQIKTIQEKHPPVLGSKKGRSSKRTMPYPGSATTERKKGKPKKMQSGGVIRTPYSYTPRDI